MLDWEFNRMVNNSVLGGYRPFGYNGQKVVMFDYELSIENDVNYAILERLKNGLLYNTKYIHTHEKDFQRMKKYSNNITQHKV